MQNLLIIDPDSDFIEWAQRHLSADHVHVTDASGSTKLLMRSPLSFAGPQPKQRFFGAYVS